MDTRNFSRWVLALIALAALAGGWLALLPPDDLRGLAGVDGTPRPGARAAEAARQCREALMQERPGLIARAIAVRSVSSLPGSADPATLRVEGVFRDSLATETAIRQFTCDVPATGRPGVRIHTD